MLNRTAQILNARTLLVIAGTVFGFFVLSGISASLWGQHPTNNVADVFSSVVWFGFLIGIVVLIAVSVLALIAHAATRSNSAQRGGVA
jgi:hypothetical protein